MILQELQYLQILTLVNAFIYYIQIFYIIIRTLNDYHHNMCILQARMILKWILPMI